MSQETDRVAFQRNFWNAKAEENAHFHILGDFDMWDDERREPAFEAAGVRDATKLSLYTHPDATVVDLGCGIGRVVKRLAPLSTKVYGCDISKEMIEQGETYLEGVDNASLVRTTGADISAVPDASVDFLYSLLCLIHIEKRSAWRYFKDFSRAVKDQGLLFLQVHDIMSGPGLEKFASVVESDYPLEFYTEEEARWLLGSHGIEVLHVERNDEFMNLVCVRGNAKQWQENFSKDIRITRDTAEGFFDPNTKSISTALSGRATLTVENLGPSWRAFRLVNRIDTIQDEAEHVICQNEATLHIAPGETLNLEVSKPKAELSFHSKCTGTKSCLSMPNQWGSETELKNVDVNLHLTLIPVGFEWNAKAAAAFPEASHCHQVEWEG